MIPSSYLSLLHSLTTLRSKAIDSSSLFPCSSPC
uniref:Uncharacterized protein n=1 Tax=Tetranychus urticae TaxID=32264 RepID=T1JXN0_TETUR